ncbi:MAG TPA: glycosyltransferase family 2 protein [Tepidiformaceae bacterium]|nr:glycosyltransferase family 2 protein [Tepidiformaceae bacterium]
MQWMWRLARIGLLAAQAAIVAVSLYQTAITLLGYRRRNAGLPSRAPASLPRFGLLVCARNEEAVIARIVSDLLTQDYPVELRDVLVVAHNCTDSTASAAARAGAAVIELNTEQAGKSYAVQAGADQFDDYDYVGVFDADARVGPGFLSAIAQNSGGAECIQAETIPVRTGEWLAEGYGFGRSARNIFWWRPREALGLTTTITGSGWFIRPGLLHHYRSGQWTMTEDLELSARLVAEGHVVRYVSAAQVAMGEPHDLRSSVQQRSRWVRGHIGVVHGRWLPLARVALRGNPHARDLAIYLVVPTRLLTRLGVTFAAVCSAVAAPVALPGAIVLPALAGEWAVPSWIAWREGLLQLSTGSLSLAVRHTLLSLLWFPIGAWAMITARVRAWAPTARSQPEGATHVR